MKTATGEFAIDLFRFMGKVSGIVFVCVLLLAGPGLAGKKNYLKTELSQDFQSAQIARIGVAVFSKGRGDTQEYYKSGVGKFLKENVDPDTEAKVKKVGAIKADHTFSPHASLFDASRQLGEQVAARLRVLGYESQKLTLPHNREIPMEQVFQAAREAGVDAVYVVEYAAFTEWGKRLVKKEDEGVYLPGETITTTKTYGSYQGFLYIPSASLFQVEDNSLLWSCTIRDPKAIFEQGTTHYATGAEMAAQLLFDPPGSPESFQGIPRRP